MTPHTFTAPSGTAYACTCPVGQDHALNEQLMVWTIYHHPADYPSVPYVVRGWLIVAGVNEPIDSGALGFADTLSEARSIVPAGLARWERGLDDDPVIVESWI